MIKWLVIPLGLVGFFMCSFMARYLHAIDAGPNVYFALRFFGLLFISLGITGFILLSLKGMLMDRARELLDD